VAGETAARRGAAGMGRVLLQLTIPPCGQTTGCKESCAQLPPSPSPWANS
jgi:hypothetical protein